MSTPPSSIDQPVRKLTSAPAPTSTTSVFSTKVQSLRARPASVSGTAKESGRFQGIQETLPERSQVIAAARSAETPSAAACREPWPPRASGAPWMARSVSAVAVPVGKASPSRLMSWRLMGMAVKTPSAAMAPNQPIIGSQSGRTVVTIMSAPNAAMLPPPVM